MIESEVLTWNSKVANAILAQVQGTCLGESRELPADTAVSHKCVQEEEEQLPLFYQVPLPRLLSWSRWWHITARALLIAYQKRFWGLVGNYLKGVVGAPNPHLALVRIEWGRGRGRLLRQLSEHAPK